MKFLILFLFIIITQQKHRTYLKQTSHLQKNKHTANIKQKISFKQQSLKKIDTKEQIQLIPANIDHDYEFSDFFDVFHHFSLLRIEIQAIFKFADVNKNNKIEGDEWENFYQLFIQGFITCDTNQDFLIDLKELTDCEEFTEEFTKIELTSEYIFKVYGKKEEEKLNLDNYLYIRKILFAWEQCSNNLEMSISHIACGLEIASPQTSQYANYAFDIFHQIQKLKFGVVNDNQAVHLNIQDFLLVAFIYTQYEMYEFPCRDGVLSKKELEQAIMYQKVPSFINQQTIDVLFYDNKVNVDFNDFSVFYYVVMLFNRYGEKSNGLDILLNEEQFTGLLNDEFFPIMIKNAIQNSIEPNKKGIEKVKELKKTNHQMTAEQFFISFLELKQDPESKGTEENYKKILKVIYSIFENDNLKSLTFKDYYHFYKFSTIFIQADQLKNYFVNEQQLRAIINEPQQLPLKCSSEQLMTLSQINDLIEESKQTSINIKQFLAISFYKIIFERIKLSQITQKINVMDELGINLGLLKMGMFIEETSLIECQQGKEMTTKQVLYNYKMVFQKSLADEGIALRLSESEAE